jgi:hypothetical protein
MHVDHSLLVIDCCCFCRKKGAGKEEKKGIVAYLLELIAHFRSWLGFAASRHIPDGPDTIPHPGMRL